MDFSNGIALVQSKTFWGAFLALLAVIAQQFGLTGLLSWVADPHTLDTVMSFAAIGGSIFAIFGRYTATKAVTSVVPPAK